MMADHVTVLFQM